MKLDIGSIEYVLPETIEDGRNLMEDNPEWRIADIEEKTGIQSRHIASESQTAVDLAQQAAKKMFAKRSLQPDEIDFLILVTQSADYALPTSACILQDRLSLKTSCIAFDVNLGCSGFIYGLAIAGGLIESNLAKKGLLICSDTYTKYIDDSDRTCRPIFSDGAACVLLKSSEHDCIGPFELGTDGSGENDLIVPMSGARRTSDQDFSERQLFMNGSNVFMFTMKMVPECVTSLLEKAGKTIDEIDLFVFHQASKLVIDSIIRRLDIEIGKVYINYHHVGNTVSASIPIALDQAVAEKRLKKGDQVMMVGFGVGYSWGACLVNWGETE